MASDDFPIQSNSAIAEQTVPNVGATRTSIAILGTGVWGSALATLAQSNQHPVQVWSRRGEATLAEVVVDVDLVISAIAMKGVTEIAAQLQALHLPPEVILVSATKGLDPDTMQTPSQIWQEALPKNPVVVLSGPNLSQEIEQGLPAATVAASTDLKAAERVQDVFASERFRVYTNADCLGTELGGTLKNVVAIAIGVCDGLQLGTNARSALMTRALPEIIRVGTHLGGKAETFLGLSGLGDLLATCTSPLSRNYQVGYQLAHGKSLEQILANLKGTAEGINTTNVLIDLANRDAIAIPISRLVYQLLNGKCSPQEAVAELMARDLKPEACLL
ncbi:MAG: NAD(P)H-dependent glycerol-3-phosphate dehydrogenase [Thermosynechococcaceae cyanobacterium]